MRTEETKTSEEEGRHEEDLSEGRVRAEGCETGHTCPGNLRLSLLQD